MAKLRKSFVKSNHLKYLNKKKTVVDPKDLKVKE